MSDQRVFSRYKASEINAELQSYEVNKFKLNSIKRKNALRKIVANLTLGNYNEMSLLGDAIHKFWQIDDDFEVKRICHEYVSVIGSMKPRLVVDFLPSIQDDLKSRNSKVQVLALRTLMQIPSSEFLDEAMKFSKLIVSRKTTMSKDVTKAAILNLIQLDEMNHEEILKLVPYLFEISEDQSEAITIRVAALHTLYLIHEKNPQMAPLNIGVDAAFNILENIEKANEWDKGLIIETLPVTVVPNTHDDAYDLIDLILPQLQNVNTYVALGTLKFILYLLNYVDSISETVIKRISNSIVALLDNPPEIQFLILRNVILLLLSRGSDMLKLDISYFFIQFNDPIYIKDTKLECLYLLANKNNLTQILDELEQYATDIDIQMSRKAIRAVGNLAVKLDDSAAANCCDTLADLLDFGVDFVIQEIISVFRNIFRKYPNNFKDYVPDLIKCIDIVEEPESINAMIWIITHYYNSIPNYLDEFKQFSDSIEGQALEVQYSILSSSVKFFLRSPSEETEANCINILKYCTEKADNIDLRNRAFGYWRLLALTKSEKAEEQLPIDTALKIIDGELPMLELNTKLDSAVLEELELNMGSIVSVYLKPASQIFKNSKLKSLPKNSILIENREQLVIRPDSKNSIPEDVEVNDYFAPRKFMSGTGTGNSTPGTPHSGSSSQRKTMADYDRPAEKVNQLSGKRKSSTSSTTKLSRKPSQLLRRISLKKTPF